MEKRRLGTSDLYLTTIGLGTWAIGGGGWQWGWGPQDEGDSLRTIQTSLDLGINWIDTAPVYGLGLAETLVGKAIRGRREQVIIATKCGQVWDEQPGGRVVRRLDAESIRREVEASLRRLQVDVIDLYQIHWPDPEAEIETAWEVIADLIRAGKVRYGGVSNFSVPQLERVQPIHPVVSVQPEYSMLVRAPEERLLTYCDDHQIGVIACSPLRSGLLTDSFSRPRVAQLDAKDWRRADRDFQEPRLTANLQLIEKLKQIAYRHNRPLVQLATAWVIEQPEVTAAIVGARRPDQIANCVAAADWELSEEVLIEIEELLLDHEELMARELI